MVVLHAHCSYQIHLATQLVLQQTLTSQVAAVSQLSCFLLEFQFCSDHFSFAAILIFT